MARAAAIAALVVLAPALALASRKEPRRPVTQPRVVIETAAGQRLPIEVELARTAAEQRKGLMGRRELPENRGMLFLFDTTRVQSFWMQNTLIPLDMIFISEDGRIVGIVENAEPLTETERSVGKPSRYVLEVNGGWTRAHAVAAGDRVRFENLPTF